MPTAARVPHPLTVLVVDDSQDTANSMAELLGLYGHVVRVAFDGEEALRVAAETLPDVVLLDLLMPRMDGYGVAKQIRERGEGVGKRPLLVAVTGYSSDADRLRTAEAGFDLHLVKPVDPGVIVGVLERFRRLIAPTIPAADLEPPPEDPPDPSGPTSDAKRVAFALS
jgi:CheY-like chemotaxis protein